MDQSDRPKWTADAEAFGALYERHADALIVFFARRTCDVDVAVELAAETFAQAYVARRRFRGSTEEEAAGWLYGIARNELSHWLRRGAARRRALRRLAVTVPAAAPDEHTRIEELAGIADLRVIVAAELAKLSPAHREALELRVVHELSYEEVARRLRISEQAARARVSRGLRALAAALDRRPLTEGERA
jgi:RNA polymerase sigma factor (sigma-70 family)